MGSIGPIRVSCAASAAALLLAISACGSEDGEDPADFAATVDPICAEAVREQTDLAFEFERSGALAETATYMDRLQAAGEKALADLEAVEPPPDLTEPWERYLANRREAIEVVGERAEAARDRDSAAVEREAVELAELLLERDEIGAELGLEACARILPDPDEEAILGVIELAAVSEDAASICRDALADVYLTQQFGGDLARCERAQARTQRTDEVRLRAINGISEVAATAEVSFVGGAAGGTMATLQLVHEDGAYRIFELSGVSAEPE